ncbi:MAG: hypothetical protein H7070_04250 [Saprospiraceae bacterium]|nr:hypothetical protein [Pyrinomonadaceae bacterium]
MSVTKMIDPAEWTEFLSEFSERNRGRRARFELFRRDGEVAEESQEGYFEQIGIEKDVVTIERKYKNHEKDKVMNDAIPNIHGISVQLDTDESENTLEFTNDKGDMTVLHFESMVDGGS